jgi:hypothetical protein
MIVFRIFRRRRYDEALNGIVMATLFYAILFFIWYLGFPEFHINKNLG